MYTERIEAFRQDSKKRCMMKPVEARRTDFDLWFKTIFFQLQLPGISGDQSKVSQGFAENAERDQNK